jgi:hypothetical protein
VPGQGGRLGIKIRGLRFGCCRGRRGRRDFGDQRLDSLVRRELLAPAPLVVGKERRVSGQVLAVDCLASLAG